MSSTMKTLIPLLLLLSCQLCPRVQAQAPVLQVFAPGGIATGPQTFTLGETFVAYHATGNALLTEGFHQPQFGPMSALPQPEGPFSLDVFPNPTLQDATLRATQARDHALAVQLIDLHGRILWTSALPPGELELRLPLAALASAVYVLRVSDPTGSDATHLRIEKIAY
jgi:hypothetical protein